MASFRTKSISILAKFLREDGMDTESVIGRLERFMLATGYWMKCMVTDFGLIKNPISIIWEIGSLAVLKVSGLLNVKVFALMKVKFYVGSHMEKVNKFLKILTSSRVVSTRECPMGKENINGRRNTNFLAVSALVHALVKENLKRPES